MINDIAIIPLQILALLYAIVIHEWAHGFAAYKMGDNTAYYMGRLTLNPIRHMDLFGTVLLPLLLIVTRSPILFGWAKPVPVNPNNFRDFKKGEVVVSLAGVTANILSALLFTALVFILRPYSRTPFVQPMIFFFIIASVINVILFAFNLIPIPPLDGSHILMLLLPPKQAMVFNRIAPYGFVIILGLLLVGVIDVYLRLVLNLYFTLTGLPLIF
ncbi:site-2 protease family protein [Candidatus Mcinerneyibacteriota bacterium]|nr:site-2 protease family protein [Candidatus Mcinerneyibacteriota bacterium]